MTELRYRFPHENMDCYQLAVDVFRRVRKVRFATPAEQRQATRAASSVVLNIAEGVCRYGGNRRNLLRSARGSAAEVASCMDIAHGDNDDIKVDCRRIAAMIHGLIRAGEGRSQKTEESD